MLPSELEMPEIELIIDCLNRCWRLGWLTSEEMELAASAKEKLRRYAADECCWHGRVG